jgi:integrase
MQAANPLNLTSSALSGLEAGSERYIVWDTALKGFGCRVETSGTKSFFVRYRPNGGGRNAPKRFFTLGRFPVLSPNDARREARRVLGAVSRGEDPAKDRRAARKDMTISDLCDVYMREAPRMPTRFGRPKNTLTLNYDQGRIDRHIKPLIGQRLVGDVTAVDVRRFMRDIARGKTAIDEKIGPRRRIIVRGGTGAATRVMGLLSGIFSFAVAEGIRPDNPVRGVKRYADGRSERTLTVNELSELGKALETAEAQGVNLSAIAIIRLLTFTGARRNEIAGLKWDEVDFERDVIRLGPHRHKAGAQVGSKMIPLTQPTRAILADLAKYRTSEFVFPASSGKSHFQGIKRVWLAVRAMAGLEDVRLHDLRHSFASIGVSSGDSLPIIGALLGHSNARTTERYTHLSRDPVRKAADRIALGIAEALGGKRYILGRSSIPPS